jgi:predicted alpha/beta-fold hydrolase
MKYRISLFMALVCAVAAQAAERTAPNLPAYTFPIENGLYATIAGYLKTSDVELKGEHSYELKVPDFKEKMPVKAVIQKHTAPLVVVLLGLGGRTNADFSRLWVSWYADAGYHVLYFDSTFTPPFVHISGYGVTGNLWAESARVALIIQSFMNEKDIRGKVSNVGVVGMSYGGTQALILGRMAKDGKLPFQLAGIQAYSPPVSMDYTAEVLDKWYREERWKYTLAELKRKIGDYRPSPGDDAVPFSESMMKAAIGASFHEVLPDLIMRNDEYFKLNKLARGSMMDDSFVRRDDADQWGFARFAFDMALPYWKERLGENAITEMVENTRLAKLLHGQPSYSETILAADDPFNPPEAAGQLKASGVHHLTVLPHGGHLGFVGEPWTHAKLLHLFDRSPQNTGPEKFADLP